MTKAGQKETGSFRAESATSCHPYRLGPTIPTADPKSFPFAKITDANGHLEAASRLLRLS